MATVYVLNKDGKPLMPTTRRGTDITVAASASAVPLHTELYPKSARSKTRRKAVISVSVLKR